MLRHVFGRWTAVEQGPPLGGRTAWWCICTCAAKTRRVVIGKDLRNGKSSSCGCIASEAAGQRESDEADKRMIGKIFTRWTVVRRAGTNPPRWFCSCECTPNVLREVAAEHLLRGASRSCGCLRDELVSVRSTRHGHTKGGTATREYTTWAAMLKRCYHKNHRHYDLYGGRGISVCERWRGPNGFLAFLEDMGERPPGKTIDRFPDKDGNYEKSNCRWATWAEQARNRNPKRWRRRPVIHSEDDS